MRHTFLRIFLVISVVMVVSGRQCYHCLVKEGCIRLDASKPNTTRQCGQGVQHCVTSSTFSKVTGVVAMDYTCGGRIYQTDDDSSSYDGCFEGLDNPGDRTKRSVCYCSRDLCNFSSFNRPPCLIYYLAALLLLNTRWIL